VSDPPYDEGTGPPPTGPPGYPPPTDQAGYPPPAGPPGYPPPYPGYQPGYQPYLPPQDHPQATLAMILGIVGVVVCQVVGPFAWVIGKRAMNEIDASGGALGGRGQAQAGFILGIISTVLLGLGLIFFVIWLIAIIGLASTST
jgi:hypothetical protein